MIDVVVEIACQPGRRQQVLEAVLANQARVQAEVGCVAYRPLVDVAAGLPEQQQDGDGLVVLEQWQSLKHRQAHLASPHMLDFQRDTSEWIQQVRLRVLASP
ncbi:MULTISPECIES: antibiotic biosynthesis monooxygenase [unclassified Pseudomonas]|uniref:putative quinol monooxygenase n=1 Tax=unclassified Pseudomonas TaxID=196821 RepID=UPI00244ABFF2|nr:MULTISPECIES: antibiotic biosynthesis monooxygenase [unclassified Pseudomonas]MDG9929157.1 antibiotic biosynthesis monooxygenase [Pseudomonas sp. GD04042]MDH0484061.1 antibiotic biosynthesis monooxygenase [Pseudomonas sp. GD04015]MDH0605869.1 antibiotic biosynthesis monooxygenase [Pseudomonas sp. GD03869]